MGQKIAYFFYQREFIPIPDKNLLLRLENNVLLKQMTTDLFDLFKRDAIADIERLREAFVDSGLAVHFLYLTRSPNDVPLSQAIESSQDVYRPLSQMAKATGGIVSSSADSVYLMRKASQASASYYLLYRAQETSPTAPSARSRSAPGSLTVAHTKATAC
jgi:hypothetical protein